jgi:hypothetical protein
MAVPFSNPASDELAVKGKNIRVRAINVGNFTIVVSGRLIRIATVKDEPWQRDCVSDPATIISALRTTPKPTADIFVFSQRLPDTARRFEFHCEYDNVAAIPISTYDHWRASQIKPSARNKLRKAEKNGVTTRVVDFDDALVHGITAIYNESPVRQGKKFWHYGKDFDTVKRENGTYSERSEFIGAFLKNELIGFVKMVYVGCYAEVMQILSMIAHREKAPTNALIAKAVEVCCEKSLSHFVYSNFAYGKKGDDSLSEFKRANGFLKIDIPKYFIPLTVKGRIALALRLHRGPTSLLPRWLVVALISLRTKWNDVRFGMK